MKVPEKFDSAYNSSSYEPQIYQMWEESGYFNPDKCIADKVSDTDQEAFSIVLPPPNITGHLHIGHAAMIAIEDVLVRYARMSGRPTLWVPGTDHAAIATQSKFEKLHQKETGKRRHDYSREEFFDLVHEYAVSNQTYILEQLKELGGSLDWSRYAFTLDDDRQEAVAYAFKKMYDAGLIYQKDRIVNWDPKGQTTVSDDEIIYQSGKATLYTFKYSSDFPIQIATTRLETKVGDVAVAVHPDDSRYQAYIGKVYDIKDFCGVPLSIKIIASESVDPEYGTGALGVTPAHSQIDWEMAEAAKLPIKQVINEYAKMTEAAGGLLSGQKTTEARETVAMWLRDNNLLINEDQIDQNLSTAERTGGVIEPLPKLQWWVAVDKKFELNQDTFDFKKGDQSTLKELMLKAVSDNYTDIIPERYERVYFDWINKLRDWNISRQIIYGHRIPVWTKDDQIHIGLEAPDDTGWQQDPDTLDTWFSSGLWPFSTLGWPSADENTDSDFNRYFPNSLLETGYDILFFWIARMILMSTFFTGHSPFKTAYMHGLVRDEHGRKMSKSLGNTIEPRDLTDEYGTDALRMALLVGVGPGADNNLGQNKVKAYRNFSNKIWNATRFVLLSMPDNYVHADTELVSEDKALLDELNNLVVDVTDDLDNYRLHLASEKLYSYFWHTFADVIIESKKHLVGDNYDPNNPASLSAAHTLYQILITCLKLLHPFMPFITEEIWQDLPHQKAFPLLMVTRWPNK